MSFCLSLSLSLGFIILKYFVLKYQLEDGESQLLEGKGRFWRTNRKLYVYVPSEVVSDSTFPFTQEKGYIKIKIDKENNRLIIEHIENI